MTGTGVEVAATSRGAAATDLLRGNRVVQGAVAMIAAQLVFRAWATYGMWFRYDDFNLMSRMMNDGPGLGSALREYSGHVRPISMWLSWLANAVAPFDFSANATILLALQLAADLGLLVLLLRLFGPRPGILPPLAVYLFSVISVPVAIWWVSGAAQIPLQGLLFWTMNAHLGYLRSGRSRDAIATGAWVVLGFCFHEKTLLTLGALAIFSASYFASGGLLRRVAVLARQYWVGVLVYAVLGAGYLVLYIRIGLTFDPGRAGQDGVGDVVSNMVVDSWLPAMVGGPLRWEFAGANTFPRPPLVLVLVALLVVALVVRELARTRRRSLRSWTLLLFFLGADIVLVHAGRTSYVGPELSLDYRFQGELAAVTAVALACAAMPVRGAVETVEQTADSWLVDVPRRAAALTVVVSVLATVSAAQLAEHWQRVSPGRSYFGRLFEDLSRQGQPVPLVDAAVPARVMFALSYPENALSHLLHDDPHGARFVDVATDHLWMVDRRGHVEPAVVPVTRHAKAGPRPPCGYRLRTAPVRIPLDGALAYGGWWVRIGYLADATSPVTVTAGDASYTTTVQPGVHALYVRGGGRFRAVRVSGLGENVTVCTDDVTVGRPVPRSEFQP